MFQVINTVFSDPYMNSMFCSTGPDSMNLSELCNCPAAKMIQPRKGSLIKRLETVLYVLSEEPEKSF